MIYARLSGGTGNQLFQIAFCIKLQLLYNQDICFDASEGVEFAGKEGDSKKNTILNDLSLDFERIRVECDKKRFDKEAGYKMFMADMLMHIPRIVRKITKNDYLFRYITALIQKIFNPRGMYTAYDCYCQPVFNMANKDIYVTGLFSCSKYFDDIYDKLCRLFDFSKELDSENKRYLDLINNTNAVCVHIRKGASYKNNPYLNVCTDIYYEKAMEYLKKAMHNPTFYIFTNDKEWCKAYIKTQCYNCVYVEANDSKHAIEELTLMRSCDVFILSNSTFGWWAQYFSKGKCVVSPDVWSKGKVKLLVDLIQDDWIKINSRETIS